MRAGTDALLAKDALCVLHFLDVFHRLLHVDEHWAGFRAGAAAGAGARFDGRDFENREAVEKARNSHKRT